VTYERQKRYRQNRKQGLRWYNLCLPDYLVERALVDTGVITKEEADDQERVRAALQAHLTERLEYHYPEKKGGNYDNPDNECEETYKVWHQD
jgi:hypothetical protein